jgi:hypothetical protein
MLFGATGQEPKFASAQTLSADEAWAPRGFAAGVVRGSDILIPGSPGCVPKDETLDPVVRRRVISASRTRRIGNLGIVQTRAQKSRDAAENLHFCGLYMDFRIVVRTVVRKAIGICKFLGSLRSCVRNMRSIRAASHKIVPKLLSWAVPLTLYLTLSIASESKAKIPPVATHRIYFVAVNGSDTGPGTADLPWATVSHASEAAIAGDTVVVHGGHYFLKQPVRLSNSGRPNAWITFIGYPGEEPILDAESIQLPTFVAGALNNGALQIEGVSHIRVANLTVFHSHDAGITVRDSSDIDLINNNTDGTFASGIAVWDTNHDDRGTRRIRVIGNTIKKATTWDFAPPDAPHRGEPPHEALSIGGAIDFEVAYNHVLNSDKEGIVIKETSKRGKVHHNRVENLARQGIYVGSYFGEVSDIELFANAIYDCRGAGFVLSVEDGKPTERINFHDNLVFNNKGSGVYFSRWGVENIRRNIKISKNIFYHNGYGTPSAGQTYYWNTGGIYLYSANIYNVLISKNIFSENNGFQIGYSELFQKNTLSWKTAAAKHKILIDHNLLFGDNRSSPIESGGDPFDRVKIYATNGDWPTIGDPLFKDPASNNFTLLDSSPVFSAHIFSRTHPKSILSPRWWKETFRPKMINYFPSK